MTRVKSVNGVLKVKNGYIKAGKSQNNKKLAYEIPEFCLCDEIHNGVASLVLGQNDYIRRNGDDASIVLNAATTIAKWDGKKMRKAFQQKMRAKIYRRCLATRKG